MESEDGVSAADRQSEPMGAGEDAPLSPQQTEAVGAAGVLPAAAQQPERMDDAPTVPQQLKPTGARDSSPVSAQRLQPTGSVSATGIIFHSMSVSPTLQTHPEHQPPLPQEASLGSSSGSSSVWISNATDATNFSSASLHSNHTRHNGHVHTDGSDNENGTGPRVSPSGSLSRDTGRAMVSVPPLGTDGVLIQEATHIGQLHGSSNGSANSRKDSSLPITSSNSLHCSTTSSSSEPTTSSIFDLRSCSILNTAEEESDWMAFVKPFFSLVETYGGELKRFEHLQAEEYVLQVIKSYVGIASTLTAEMHINAREVFDTSTNGESSGRESPLLNTEEEVQRSELCACLKCRLWAVTDYVRRASEITTEQAIAERILQQYRAAMRKAERSSSSRAASSGVSHGFIIQERGELPGGKINSHSHLASGSVKEVSMEGTSAEESGSHIQNASGSVKREREVEAEDAVEPFSVKAEGKEDQSERSLTICGSNSNRGCTENDSLIHFEYICPETEKQREFRKSHERASLLKMLSLVDGHMCAIRTVNSVMLRCLNAVTGIVKQALEAHTVSQRAISVTAVLRSAGSSWDYISAMAEAGMAASQCAETAVREIEKAEQLHKLVIEALYRAERALFGVKTVTTDGPILFQQLIVCVKLIEEKVNRACRTYLDNAIKGRDSSDPDNSIVFPTTDGIDSPVVTMAFENIGDGPSDVFQALIWACQSSVNALRMIVTGLQDFSIAKLGKPRRSDNE